LQRNAPVLDNPEKTALLLAALKAAAPFAVRLRPELIDYLRAENLAGANGMPETVFDLSYAGDEGGIMCHVPLDRDRTGSRCLSHSCSCAAIAAVRSCSSRLPKASRQEAKKAALQLSLVELRS
jgi:hypothetical protein